MDNRTIKAGGNQVLRTHDGYSIPLNIKNALPRMHLRPYTDEEWNSLPHVFLTSEETWDPSVLDLDISDDSNWFNSVIHEDLDDPHSLFDDVGNYRQRVHIQSTSISHLEDSVDTCVMYHTNKHLLFDINWSQLDPIPTISSSSDWCTTPSYTTSSTTLATNCDQPQRSDTNHFYYNVFNGEQSLPTKPVRVTPSTPDYEKQRPLFGWLPVDTIKRTYDLTTQYGRIPMSTILKKRYKAPNPALNVYRRDESVATDTFFSDTPAIDCGVTIAQFFVGCDSMVCDAYPMKSSKQFVNTLEDNIRERGAMNRLISDSARDEMSSKVKDILRTLLIGAWQSEAYHQHQNPSERRFQTVKTQTNRILDRTGAPPSTWLLCLLYVIFLLNHTFCNAINAVPIQLLRSSTPDISPLLCFYF